jgi:beta-hydroxyacyl-ACP dehydratase FabZ
MTEIFDIQAIMDLLPHRYPFLLIDRVLSIVPGENITALKNVSFNEPFFQGHFPGNPIMPGVLIIEAMCQAGGLLALKWIQDNRPEQTSNLIYLAGMDKVRFRRPVVPGDQLVFEVEMLKIRSKVVKMRGMATVDTRCVAEAELMASLGEQH